MFKRSNLLNFYTINSISTANNKFISQNSWGSQHFLDIWILVEFMFKSLLRSIKCMPLHFCDLYTTSMYLHKRVCASITLRRISEIVYVQNFISSPVIKQMIRLIFLHNQLFIYKLQFLSSKTAWSASRCNCRASTIFMMTSYWQMHCDHKFAKN